ncbi:MAG: indolepyruvate ferredoxin oxidoreductase [Oligoflexia bacterium]|nr:indolepyruvate ferredoxin oxidoreductase [Oligoflexia bacterium]
MKDLGKILLDPSEQEEIMMGNYSLVRAMIESGTKVITSYPGSPTPEIATAIAAVKRHQNPFYFEFSTNEKVATEVAFGASINGHLSCVFFKSVGLNVAADTFAQLAYMELIGGMIIVLGDDPGLNSSQNEQDNRHLAQLAYIPVLEPGNSQEVYEMYKMATIISQKKHMPVILRLTTHVCHGKSLVKFNSYSYRYNNSDLTPKFNRNNGPYIPITSRVVPMKLRAFKNLEELSSSHLVTLDPLFTKLNIINKTKNINKRGIITAGLPYYSLLDVLSSDNNDVHSQNTPDILKLGLIYPLPKEEIANFLSTHKEVKILEELDGILEKEIKEVAFDKKIYDCNIIGKQDIDDYMGEYTPEKVYSILRKVWPDLFTTDKKYQRQNNNSNESVAKLERPPQLCPGCGHRAAFFAIKKALDEQDITVADIGCHTLGFLPPYHMGEVLLCMGASPAIASGLSLFNSTRKVVAFIGDSTFYHAGIPGIINSLFNHHPFLLIVMENGTTAMTGHQNHPGVGKNFNGDTERIPIRKILEGLTVPVQEIDTYNKEKLTELVRSELKIIENEKNENKQNSLRVIIAKHPCMLKLTKEKKSKADYTLKQVSIDQSQCTKIFSCISEFACPSFSYNQDQDQDQDRNDNKLTVNKDLCIGDGSCRSVCASKAILPPAKQ